MFCVVIYCVFVMTQTHKSQNTIINLSTQEFYLKQIKTIKSHFKKCIRGYCPMRIKTI